VLLHELWKLLAGRIAEAELIGVTESEDVPHAAHGAEASR